MAPQLSLSVRMKPEMADKHQGPAGSHRMELGPHEGQGVSGRPILEEASRGPPAGLGTSALMPAETDPCFVTGQSGKNSSSWCIKGDFYLRHDIFTKHFGLLHSVPPQLPSTGASHLLKTLGTCQAGVMPQHC